MFRLEAASLSINQAEATPPPVGRSTRYLTFIEGMRGVAATSTSFLGISRRSSIPHSIAHGPTTSRPLGYKPS